MKKVLLTSAALLVSSAAYAADYAVVHPFYTPAQGKFVSATALDYTHEFRGDKDGGTSKEKNTSKIISETVEYGVTDDIQVGLAVARTWDKSGRRFSDGDLARDTEKDYTNSWEVSVGYNVINDGKTFLNVGMDYSQSVRKDKPFDPAWGIPKNDTHGKYIGLNVFGGYNFDEFTVFGGIDYTRQIDGEKEDPMLFGPEEKSKVYSLEAGVFKAFNDQISAQTSLSADITDGVERDYWWNVGANYSISKKMAVGLNASYMLENDVRGKELKDEEMHRVYKFGMDFTIEF